MPKKFEILVDFMVEHSNFAKGLLQCGNAKQRQQFVDETGRRH